MADTMLPAAPVTRNTVSLFNVQTGLSVRRGLFREADAPAQPSLVADLDGAGIAQGLRHQRLGHFRGVARRFEIDGLDEARPGARVCMFW